jgi:hypothetical protein
MIVYDFPICNDGSLFAKDFREDFLAKFEKRLVIFCHATISSSLMSKKLGLFALRSRSLLAVGLYYKKMLLQLL